MAMFSRSGTSAKADGLELPRESDGKVEEAGELKPYGGLICRKSDAEGLPMITAVTTDAWTTIRSQR